MKNIFIVIRNKHYSLFFLITFFILTACGGSGGGGGGGGDTVVVSGQITYDRVPDTDGGLDYTAIVQLPVRRVLVAAIDASSGTILENTHTNNLGEYSITAPAGKSIKISVYSESQNPIVRVQDNFIPSGSEFARFVLQSAAFTTAKGVNVTKNLNADSGYNKSTKKLSNSRDAAPFAILDNCLQASDFFLANRTVNFPKLTVNWSENNNTSTIQTSNWSGTELYILGDADVDTDEYDQHVIVHEWGHYFESVLGRSESIGGRHTDGDVLDPRVAFSEGWGNALSAMVLYPDSVYKDTGGFNQSITGIKFDVDENNAELKTDSSFKIGWFSENSIQNILYDIFDPAADDAGESWDLLSSNSGVIYDIFTSNIKNSESLITIFTFVDGYLSINPADSLKMDALLAKHQINTVTDAFGTGETNDGGISGSLPIYKALALGAKVVLDFSTTTASNYLADTQYITIAGVSGKATISATGGSAKELSLYYKGEVLDGASGLASVSISNFNFDVKKTYILTITNNDLANKITVSLNP